MQDEKIIPIELSLEGTFPTVNCFLVKGAQLTLVDCGKASTENWEIFTKKINKADCLVKDIQKIVLTHQHTDHIGLLPRLLNETEATVYAPKITQPYMDDYQGMMHKEGTFQIQYINKLNFPETLSNILITFMKDERTRIGTFTIPKDRLKYFEDTDDIIIGTQNWKALYVPGHCSTQFCFAQIESHRVFGGDMLLPLTPMTILEEDPQQKGKRMTSSLMLLDSYEKLKPYDFKKVFPGHGQPFKNANEVIERQLARIQKRKEECFQTIQNGAKTAYDIWQKMYASNGEMINFGAMFMVLGYVDLLIYEHRIEEKSDGKHLTYSVKT